MCVLHTKIVQNRFAYKFECKLIELLWENLEELQSLTSELKSIQKVSFANYLLLSLVFNTRFIIIKCGFIEGIQQFLLHKAKALLNHVNLTR